MSNDKKVLYKHNDLVTAKYETTLVKNKLFNHLLYKLQQQRDKGIITYTCPIDELLVLMKSDRDKNPKAIMTALQELRKKDLFLLEELEDGSRDFIAGGFLNEAIYNDKSREITIVATGRIHKLIHKYLEDGYTPVNLDIWMDLKNLYSQRLYDLLRKWSGTKQSVNYEVEYLKEIFMLKGKYKVYSDFKKRVIMPAIKELEDTGMFNIEINENKVGRKIESIDFTVEDLDKRRYFDTKEKVNVIEQKENGNNKEFDTVEVFEVENNTNTPPKAIETLKIENNSFFVPDEDVFTKGTLRSFKLDFKNIDFKNEYMEKAFNDAIMITLDRDDVDTIKATSYKFFKGTLDNKIEEYKLEEQEDLKHKKEMDINW